jgi:hypothetical protein
LIGLAHPRHDEVILRVIAIVEAARNAVFSDVDDANVARAAIAFAAPHPSAHVSDRRRSAEPFDRHR